MKERKKIIALRAFDVTILPDCVGTLMYPVDEIKNTIDALKKNELCVVNVLSENSGKSTLELGDVYKYAVLVTIDGVEKTQKDYYKLRITSRSRVLCVDMFNEDGIDYVIYEDADYDTSALDENINETKAYESTLYKLCRKLTSHSDSKVSKDVYSFIKDSKDPVTLVNKASMLIPSEEAKRRLFVQNDAKERLVSACAMLTMQSEMLELKGKIEKEIHSRLERTQKEYLVREQINILKRELGENETDEIDEYLFKLDALDLKENISERIRKEIIHLDGTPVNSAEYSIMRNYIEKVLELPWNNRTKDKIDLSAAKKRLDSDHYGMEKVKKRILEYLAVLKLTNGKSKSTILCLVGPPGVGKTSIAKSIAAAVGKKYIQMSLGGIKDESEIRGHRKTYVGSMPGRILTHLIESGVNNPLFLFDEIDKISSDMRGDPASALLEVLDPNQNDHFRDNYIELPFDLSEVLFIVTANDVSRISKPLLDRMEIIEMSGYTVEEKYNIAEKYLVKKQVQACGLGKGNVVFKEQAILDIIENYTRESGVRGLEKAIASICRKIAYERCVKDEKKKRVTVTPELVKTFLGVPDYTRAKDDRKPAVGAANGLAWTTVGGETLTIEAALVRGKGEIILTGNLGDVMKESARIALSLVKNILADDVDALTALKENDIHVHVPEGATPKDGPSAGIAMTSAIYSAVTRKAVERTIAMTGEVTLRGRVLAIGGLKEKTLAALRAGLTQVIIPEDNRKDIEELPESVKNGIKFTTVSDISSVLSAAIL